MISMIQFKKTNKCYILAALFVNCNIIMSCRIVIKSEKLLCVQYLVTASRIQVEASCEGGANNTIYPTWQW